MYCELCRRPVCHLCKLGGNHSNHRVSTMSSAYKTLKVGLVYFWNQILILYHFILLYTFNFFFIKSRPVLLK